MNETSSCHQMSPGKTHDDPGAEPTDWRSWRTSGFGTAGEVEGLEGDR